MSNEEQIITVSLLDRQFQIKCIDQQREALQEAAYYLDGKMREIRDSGKATGNERIAMMAALNLAFELLTTEKQKNLYLDTMSSRIRDLQQKVALALTEQK
jgi:cell division protein ZapA